MKYPSPSGVSVMCTVAVAAGLVSVGLLTAPKTGRAQENPPGAPPSGLQIAPMLGGNLPAPDQDITITWDARFLPVPRKAALLGPYVVIEGDMVVGTLDDVQ
jgi:hypothetical protein